MLKNQAKMVLIAVKLKGTSLCHLLLSIYFKGCNTLLYMHHIKSTTTRKEDKICDNLIV